jgi:transposase InsO family protein
VGSLVKNRDILKFEHLKAVEYFLRGRWYRLVVAGYRAAAILAGPQTCKYSLRRLHDDDQEGGYRVPTDDIRDLGYEVPERRVWRLCRVAGIRSTIVSRKTRYSRAGATVGENLIRRDFTADWLDEKWLVGITEHWTSEGRLCLCAFKYLRSRRIVGYIIDSRMKAALAVRALENALTTRGNPHGVIVHSDRGSQGGFNRSSQHPDDGGAR